MKERTRELAKLAMEGELTEKEQKELGLLLVVNQGPRDCTGLPCPHCDEKLPRFNIQSMGDESWVIQINDVVKGSRNMKALGNLIKGMVGA